jgi:hypothetical protein
MQAYHVYPSSASRIQLQLPKGIVCDGCNRYFSQLENYFTHHHPGSDRRLLQVPKTRKGKPPELRVIPGVGTRKDGASGSELTIPLSDLTYEKLLNGDLVLHGQAERPRFDATKVSRVLAKMAFESLYRFPSGSGLDPENPRFDQLRDYARKGQGAYVWFAWKDCGVEQRLPQIIVVRDGSHEPVASLCRLGLPGIAYLIPLPPYPDPRHLAKNLDGWTLTAEGGLHDLPALAVDMHLNRAPITDPPEVTGSDPSEEVNSEVEID